MMRLLALALLVAPCTALGQSPHAPAEQEAIEQVLHAFTDTWNRHDARAFSMLFAEDADFTNVAGVSVHGRVAIEEFHAPRFAGRLGASHQTITSSRIRLIRPDVAAVDARWEMTGARTPEGADAGPRCGLLSFVMTKQTGRWEIVVMHNANLPAQACARTD